MARENKIYISIDLKSFYASVECMERGLDPLTTNLVVADASKTEKTICLAVTPSLKKYGISGRARLYEVIQSVDRINAERKTRIGRRDFEGSSYDDIELTNNPMMKLDYIAARPRMAFYIEYSTKIYEVYLRYIAEEDMSVYSIDEVFIDATKYLKTSGMTPKEFAKTIILDIYRSTGITATAGIGTNLYLCKVAMDIRAKHIKADEDGVRIAQLNEYTYRKHLWGHRPITDFWRVGRGYAKRLASVGLYTMGDVAKCSVGRPEDFYNEDLLYNMFGVNAELLIDHAWGYEPVTMSDIRGYRPDHRSISSGQVLTRPYSFDEGRLILKEMIDGLALDLVKQGVLTSQLVIMIGYDVENVKEGFKGEIVSDVYGRKMPKKSRGTINLGSYTSSTRLMLEKVISWYDEYADDRFTIRRFSISANEIKRESDVELAGVNEQINIFDSLEIPSGEFSEDQKWLEKEKRLQIATLEIQNKYGKNSLLKGMNLEEGATRRIRNDSIGGHKA